MTMDLQLADELGTRRPAAWVSVAGPLLEREELKTRRREDLAAGISGIRGAKEGQGLTHMTVRRRDEHSRIPPAQRCSRAVRARAIAEAMAIQREPVDSSIHFRLPPESDMGNTEYKYKCSHPHPIRLQQLITQLGFRLSEGNGEAFYYLGVEDDGYPKGLAAADLEASLATLHVMAASLRAAANLVRCFPGAHGRRCALVHVQKGTQEEAGYLDVRVAVAGCVDSGKSTLVAVLTNGANGGPTLDSGRGSARVAVLRHKHELESGRTSSVSQHLLGYDAQGRVLNYSGAAGKKDVCGEACKVLTFIDIGGGARCLKTALYGLTALLPDYVLLCCAAGAGLGRVSREHLACAVALELPVVVVITKVDSAIDTEEVTAVVAGIRALAAAALPAWNLERIGQHGASGAGAAAAGCTGTGRKAGPVPEQEVDMTLVCPVVASRTHAEQVALQLSKVHAARTLNGGSQKGIAAPGSNSDVSGAAGAGKLLIPIVPISAVTGSGLDVLHALLRTLQPAAPPLHPAAAAGNRGQAPFNFSTAPDVPPTPATGEESVGIRPQDTALHSVPVQAKSPTGHNTHLAPCKPPLHPTSTPAAATTAAAAQGAASSGLELHGCCSASDLQPGCHFQVDQVFEVEGVGGVVSGTVVSGVIWQGQQLLLGPSPDGSFVLVAVAGIQRAQVPVRQVRAGQAGTLALRPVCGSSFGQQEGVEPWPEVGTSPDPLDAMHATQCHGHKQRPSGDCASCGGKRSQLLDNDQPIDHGPDAGPHTAHQPPCLHHASASVPQIRVQPGAMSASGSSTQLVTDLSTDCPTEGLSEDDEGLGSSEPIGDDSEQMAGDSDGEGNLVHRTCSAAPACHIPLPPAPTTLPQANHAYSSSSTSIDPTSMASGGRQGSEKGCTQLGSAADAVLDIMNTACAQPGAGAGVVDMSPDLLALFDMDDDGGDAAGASDMGFCDVGGSPHASRERLGDDTARCYDGGSFGCMLGESWADGDGACSMPSHSHNRQKKATQPATNGSVHVATPPAAGVTASAPAPSGMCLAHTRMRSSHQHEPCLHEEPEHESWDLGAQHLGTSQAYLPLLSRSPPHGHRGTVLLSLGLQQPRASWSFQAVLVLLGGQWPARGLVSGRWPPMADEDLDIGAQAASASTLDAADGVAAVSVASTAPAAQPIPVPRAHKAVRGKSGADFTAVVHCANIRQLARLEVLQEVPEDLLECAATAAAQQSAAHCSKGVGDLPLPLSLPGSLRAAAAVLHAPMGPREHATAIQEAQIECEGVEGERLSRDCGCIAVATFKFVKRPCWLTEGARLLLRDRNDGHVSGAGYIRRVWLE